MLSNPHVVDICLGSDQQMFRFNPKKVHDIYAKESVLYIELIVDDTWIAPYEFGYLDIEDMFRDIRILSELTH